ncbi:hypothetical protein ACLQ2R_28905 [Streptosporangium sp. DT93]|uniref:hypothetical protein n=1 Tax=Streptosporangium sp. DT93 TaxID=3393428 RepID=UPI003CEE73B2
MSKNAPFPDPVPSTTAVSAPTGDRPKPKRRLWAPIVSLLLLSPFVAELLLGDIALTAVGVVVVLVPLYGCGALLIRELARRTGRGWPAIALLAGAFGVLEEGFATMSLFNPDFAGYRLLDEAPLPFLGMGAHWTVYVLSLHVIWSICTPIALAETLFPDRARVPWLRTRGLVVTSVVFLLTVALYWAGTFYTAGAGAGVPVFRPSASQMIATAVTAVVLVLAAFAVRPRAVPSRTPGSAPSPLPGFVPSPVLVLAGSLVVTSVVRQSAEQLSGWVSVVVCLTVEVAAVAALRWYGRRREWGPAHVFAAASGAVVAYAWSSFFLTPIAGTTDPVVARTGNILFALVAVVILALAARRLRGATTARP